MKANQSGIIGRESMSPLDATTPVQRKRSPRLATGAAAG
jgi:hypothetical protein